MGEKWYDYLPEQPKTNDPSLIKGRLEMSLLNSIRWHKTACMS